MTKFKNPGNLNVHAHYVKRADERGQNPKRGKQSNHPGVSPNSIYLLGIFLLVVFRVKDFMGYKSVIFLWQILWMIEMILLVKPNDYNIFKEGSAVWYGSE